MNAAVLVRVSLALGVFGAGLMGAPAQVSACGNEVQHKMDPKVQAVASAERLLGSERPLEAALSATKFIHDLRAAIPSENGLRTRALRVAAVAAVRLGGDLKGAKSFRSTTPEQRAQNVAWAVTTLRRFSIHTAGSPGSLTDLGEALAMNPKTHDEARVMLEALAKKDLVTHAHGYAALARLRGEAGDGPGRESALALCRAIAGATAATCASGGASQGESAPAPSAHGRT